jgi:hypothetical protein
MNDDQSTTNSPTRNDITAYREPNLVRREGGSQPEQEVSILHTAPDQNWRDVLEKEGPQGLVSRGITRRQIKDHSVKMLREMSDHLLEVVKDKNRATTSAVRAKLAHDLAAVKKIFATAEFKQDLDTIAVATQHQGERVTRIFEQLEELEKQPQETNLQKEKLKNLSQPLWAQLEIHRQQLQDFCDAYRTATDADDLMKQRKLGTGI